MGDQFDFSLLIGSQYDGGPMEWDEQTLYVSTGTILNHVDINKVSPALGPSRLPSLHVGPRS